MLGFRTGFAALVAIVMLGGAVTPLQAQISDPEDARLRLGPLGLSPVIRLTNAGWDTNVLHRSDDNNPPGDLVARVSPSIDAALRVLALRVSGRSEFDYVYFRELTHLRAVDTENSGRIELQLGRVTPFTGGFWSRTRHRRNSEIDAIVERLDRMAVAGVGVRLTGKTSLEVRARRSDVTYERDAVYLDNDLSQLLTSRATGEGVTFRYALTPLTTIGVNAERHRDRFELRPGRNANSLRVAPVVEFKPFALVSGRAEVGFRQRRFLDGEAPEFRGMGAQVDLQYTLLGRTQFAVGLQRDLSYSYRAGQADYLLTGVRLVVTHRLHSSWDIRASGGRARLTYHENGSGLAGAAAGETLLNYGVDLGYYVGRTRVGAQVWYQDRTSSVSAGRDYHRMGIASSLTYGF